MCAGEKRNLIKDCSDASILTMMVTTMILVVVVVMVMAMKVLKVLQVRLEITSHFGVEHDSL